MIEIQNPKQKNALNRFGICDLFVIWCLEFVILDTKLPRQSHLSLPPAQRDLRRSQQSPSGDHGIALFLTAITAGGNAI